MALLAYLGSHLQFLTYFHYVGHNVGYYVGHDVGHDVGLNEGKKADERSEA